MDATSRELIMQRWSVIQDELLPQLKIEVGAPTPKLERVIHILEWVDRGIRRFVLVRAGASARRARLVGECFVAKAVLGLATTVD